MNKTAQLTNLFKSIIFESHEFKHIPGDGERGNQWLWYFSNDLGVSVVDDGYGQLEACLLHNNDTAYIEELGFTNARGWLSEADVVNIVMQVSQFDPSGCKIHNKVIAI